MIKIKFFDMINDKEKIDNLFKSEQVITWQFTAHPLARPGIVVEYEE